MSRLEGGDVASHGGRPSIFTKQRLAPAFPGLRECNQARWVLEQACADKVPGFRDANSTDLERVRCAVLKLSDGLLDVLAVAVSLAQADWRDALVAAGFEEDVNAHLAWNPG